MVRRRASAADPKILTAKEVCEVLGTSRTTLYKLIRQGWIPCFRVASEWRFRKDEILRWMTEPTASTKK
jgi:excisionase family DNA binding protein